MTSSSLSYTCSSLQFRALLLSLLLSLAAARPSIWDIDIDEGPAPAPQDGPPLAASAIRNRAYLPLQIGILFGAYFVVVIIVTSSLLTVGRRLRRSAQTSPRSLAMEMMRPLKTAGMHPSEVTDISPARSNPWGPSPVSPGDRKQEMWPSPDLSRKQSWGTSNKSHKQHASIQSSVVTFDESVIEEDRTKNEIEMSRLYAAVAEHEEHKKTRSLTNAQPLAQHPPELQHLRLAAPPRSPPPRQEPMSPSRTSTTSPLKHGLASPPRSGIRSTRPTPLSFAGSQQSHSRASSRTSFGSFGRKRGSVRDLSISLPISPPMGSPEIMDGHMRDYGEAEPLTPRQYNPGPPPTPPHRQDSTGSGMQQVLSSPKRSHFSRHLSSSVRSSRHSGPGSPTHTPRTATFPTFTVTHESVESLPQQLSEQGSGRQAAPKSQRKPANLAIRTGAADSSSSLPLRTAPLPLRNLGTSGFNRPPSTIKATVLEHKIDNHLRAPGTGVPATPYSPFYFPQTPLTPMTPSRLVTREERRRQKKEEGRRVATFEDAVIEEKDMWGDAY
ncbi:hypothetical protein MMC30_001250 [Trapelia coarctata]|nr:hypothetical protein [Trapelia coarctata]